MAIPIDQRTSAAFSTTLSFGRPAAERWLNIAITLLIVGLCAALAMAGWFYYSLNYKVRPRLATVQQQAQVLNAEEKIAQAQQFSVAQTQLKALRVILENHIYASNALAFLESVVHPSVRFISVDANLSSRQFSVSAVASSLTVLAEQLRIFEGRTDITDFNLKGFSLNQAGGVDFSFDMQFNGAILRK